MAGYHSFELAYLGAVYTNLLITKEPMDFYFRPIPGRFKDNLLRVAPDILPKDSIRISEVWINGHEYTDFDPQALPTLKTLSTPARRAAFWSTSTWTGAASAPSPCTTPPAWNAAWAERGCVGKAPWSST